MMHRLEKKRMVRVCLTGLLFYVAVFTGGIFAQAGILYFDENDSMMEYLADVDYDYVVARESYHYVVLEKRISGFDVSEIRYGIYDLNEEEWAMEYTALPGGYADLTFYGADDIIDFTSNGEGVFSYSYYDTAENRSYTCFISADAGGYFVLDMVSDCEDIQWNRSETTFAVVRNVNGSFFPTGTLCTVTTTGEVSEYPVSGYSGELYWNPQPVCSYTDFVRPDYAFLFRDTDGNVHLFVYFSYLSKDYIINDQRYTSRISTDSIVQITSYADDAGEPGELYIIVRNMLGEDGHYYLAIFDEDGNVVVPAVYIPDVLAVGELSQEEAEAVLFTQLKADPAVSGTWKFAEQFITLSSDGRVVYHHEKMDASDETDVTVRDYLIDADQHIMYLNPGGDGAYPDVYVLWDDLIYHKGFILKRAE